MPTKATWSASVLRDGSLVHAFRNRAQARVREHYTWDRVVDQYEQLFAEMAGLPIPQPLQQPVESGDQVTPASMAESTSASAP